MQTTYHSKYFAFHIILYLNLYSIDLPSLSSIDIQGCSFNDIREFVIDDLANLESVKIGENCFTISDDEGNDGICQITNCPNLRQLEIGNHCFGYFKSFELSNLNSIQSIYFGNNCFKNVREFVIDDLANLEIVKIGEECFRISDDERNDGICQITNCPNLRQLEIGDDCLIIIESINISNLNSIQSIKFGRKCFEYADFSLKGE